MKQRQSNNTVKIVLTGGHAATTAMAVVEELRKRQSKNVWDIYWIGAKRAFEGKSIPTLEAHALPRVGVAFRQIITGKLQTRFTFWTIPSLIKIPIGFISALILLLRIRPKIILSFGGYAAFPVVFVGWLMRIPIVIHEQTSAAGRTNKISAAYASKIALARKSSQKYFPESKSVVVGNPIPAAIAGIAPKDSLGKPPVVFITAGSRGSIVINDLILEILSDLLNKCYLVHQTGYHDFNKVNTIKKNLSKDHRNRYEVYSLIDPKKISAVYRQADIVVARAGANTVSDCIATRRPTIFIPLPHTHLDEQQKNALFAKKFGNAEILNQNGLSGRDLLKEINKVFFNWKKITNKVKDKKSPDLNASKLLVDLLEKQL